jgi:hypothetical protein
MNPGRSRREGSHTFWIRLVGVLAGVMFWSASPMLAVITDVSSKPYVDVLPGQILIVTMSITRLDPTLTGDSFSFSLPAWNPNPFFPHQEYQCAFVTKTFKRRFPCLFWAGDPNEANSWGSLGAIGGQVDVGGLQDPGGQLEITVVDDGHFYGSGFRVSAAASGQLAGPDLMSIESHGSHITPPGQFSLTPQRVLLDDVTPTDPTESLYTNDNAPVGLCRTLFKQNRQGHWYIDQQVCDWIGAAPKR